LLAGAVKLTTDCPFAPDVAVPMVGAPGTVEGTIEAEAELATPVPAELVEATAKV
jgi:hypothetical protein